MPPERTYIDYLRAAFNARPKGMFVSPNWAGISAATILGFLNPGIWLIGAGMELAYLLLMAGSPRFRKWWHATHDRPLVAENAAALEQAIAELPPASNERFQAFSARCASVLERAKGSGGIPPGQGETLNHLAWVFLGLLRTAVRVGDLLRETEEEEQREGPIEQRLEEVRQRLADQTLADKIRETLEAHAAILEQRLAKKKQGKERLDYIATELDRLDDQVRLLDEEVVLESGDSGGSLQRITGEIQGTSVWLREQRRLMGETDDILATPPPILKVQE